MSHAHDETPSGYDDYVIRLAAKTDAEEAALLEHDAEIIQLTTRCQLCGFRCSPATWDGFLGACPNCGNQRGRI